jgi:hypothetical protein
MSQKETNFKLGSKFVEKEDDYFMNEQKLDGRMKKKQLHNMLSCDMGKRLSLKMDLWENSFGLDKNGQKAQVSFCQYFTSFL